jgi:hypothetical protein
MVLFTAPNLPYPTPWRKKIYSKAAVEDIASRVGGFKSDIAMRKPLARKRFDDWKKDRKELVQSVRQVRFLIVELECRTQR